MTVASGIRSVPFGRLAMGILLGAGLLGAACLMLPMKLRHFCVESSTLALTVWAAMVFLRRARRVESGGGFLLGLGLAMALHGLQVLLRFLLREGWVDFALSPPGVLGLYFTGHLLQGVAVLCWPGAPAQKTLRGREFLDALIFTLSLFLVFWLLGLGELYDGAKLPLAQKTLQLVFFLDYALLMGLTLYRGLDERGQAGSALGFLFATFGVVAFGNLAYIGLALTHQYLPGHPLDALSPLISALYLVVALAPIPESQELCPRRSRIAGLLFPYLPFLFAFLVGIFNLLRRPQALDAMALWLGLGMVLLLLGRQLVALWDAHRFSRSLELLVQQRTQALEDSQAIILRTQRMNIVATLGAGLAHDINNLLSVVVGTTTLLEDGARAGEPPSAEDLAALRRASNQAADMVKKLMAFGRQGGIKPQVFDLRERLQGLEKLLTRLAGPKVKLALDAGPNPVLVEMDPIQVEQILVNLVANARDAMPEGGNLVVSLGHPEGRSGAGSLTVADSGTGIAEEDLAHLFQPFFTTKEPGKGTGLGLASVKAIAEECGASIAVESRVGVGTTFSLSFPLVVLGE